MQTLKAERTTVTPEVVFAPAEHRLSIEGECYPENPLPFFNPILSVLRAYFESQKPRAFEVRVQLQYINSAATMGMRSLFALLNDVGAQGTDVLVHWAFDAEDDAIEELGSDLVEDFHHIQLAPQPLQLG